MHRFPLLLACAAAAAAILQAGAQAPEDANVDCRSAALPILPSGNENLEVLMDTQNYRVLLESSQLTGSPAWTQFDADGDNSGWIHSLGGFCQQQLRSCAFRNGDQENWLITQHISKFIPPALDTYPVTIHVVVDWFFSCSGGGCSKPFDVYKYFTDAPVDEQVFTDTTKYSLLGSISPTSRQGRSSFQIEMQPGEKGFYLGVVDKGICVHLSRLAVYRGRCAGRQEGLALYPSTATPQPSHEDVHVQAQCVGNAHATSDLSLTCSAEGEWTGSPSCACDPGFVSVTDEGTGLAYCEACQAGLYRSASDALCQACPQNTVVTGVGVAQCNCLDGYFRAGNSASEDCQPPPSGDIDLAVSSTTDSSITITWNRPTVTGSSVFYRIEISNPQEVFGDFILVDDHYVDNRDKVTYTIGGLLAFTRYQVQVSVHNEVSSQDPENEQERVQLAMATTDRARPGPPSSVRGLCTVVLWDEPTHPNCELTGYEIEFEREGISQVTLVSKKVSDRFHEVQSSNLPGGSGKVSFRIRALCSGFVGEWSEQLLVCSTDEDLPTPEPCLECKECEDNIPTTAPAKITNVVALPEETMVWTAPTEVVTGYTVRVFYHNSRGRRTGVQTDIIAAGQAWLKLSDSFSLVLGVQYFFEVRAKNAAGSGSYSEEVAIISEDL